MLPPRHAPPLRPFLLERYFAEHEFSVEHLLCASDPEPCTVDALCHLAGTTPRLLDDIALGYGAPQGEPELLEAIAASIAEAPTGTDAPRLSPRDIVVAAPQELITLALGALCARDERPVVVLTPCYQSLTDTPQHNGVAVRPWPLIETGDPGAGFRLDMDALDALLDGAQGLVINLPHNPTGALCSRATFDALIAQCRAHDVWLFSDEMYRGLEAPERRLPVAATCYDRAVSLSGCSKAYGLAGLRVGWVASRDPSLIDDVMVRKDFTTICAPVLTQHLATLAVRSRDALFAGHRARIEANIARAAAFCAEHSDILQWRAPRGGPLAFIRVRGSAQAVCAAARTHGVLLLPSATFSYGDAHLRMGFGRDGFTAALAALGAALA